jgi:hypothetical protein
VSAMLTPKRSMIVLGLWSASMTSRSAVATRSLTLPRRQPLTLSSAPDQHACQVSAKRSCEAGRLDKSDDRNNNRTLLCVQHSCHQSRSQTEASKQRYRIGLARRAPQAFNFQPVLNIHAIPKRLTMLKPNTIPKLNPIATSLAPKKHQRKPEIT